MRTIDRTVSTLAAAVRLARVVPPILINPMRTLALLMLPCLPLAAQASWTQIYPSQNPPLWSDATWVSHEASGSLSMMYGTDLVTGNPATQAWRFQGGTWAPQPGALPPLRRFPSLAYDAARAQAVMFGGWSPTGGGNLDETWLWNGISWTLANPSLRPSARGGAAMAFDHARGVVVLFGGYAISTGPELNDTWEWNGSSWQPRTLPSSPPARSFAMMAFDPVNGSVLMHSGFSSLFSQLHLFNDTWSFDGSQWVQRQPATPPSARTNANMATDLHRQRVVLLGGQTYDQFAWEWDGAQWTTRYQPCPAPRILFGIGYDAIARRLILAGGAAQTPSSVFWQNDTWSFQTPSPADVAPFGSGCAGTAGTPSLAAKAFALPWLGDTMRTLVQPLPAASAGAVFVSSFGSTPPLPLDAFGMPGCELLVPTDVVEFCAAVAGRVEWAVVIPNVPSLAAVQFRQQAFVIDAAANALGLVASNGVLVTLGVR